MPRGGPPPRHRAPMRRREPHRGRDRGGARRPHRRRPRADLRLSRSHARQGRVPRGDGRHGPRHARARRHRRRRQRRPRHRRHRRRRRRHRQHLNRLVHPSGRSRRQGGQTRQPIRLIHVRIRGRPRSTRRRRRSRTRRRRRMHQANQHGLHVRAQVPPSHEGCRARSQGAQGTNRVQHARTDAEPRGDPVRPRRRVHPRSPALDGGFPHGARHEEGARGVLHGWRFILGRDDPVRAHERRGGDPGWDQGVLVRPEGRGDPAV
mmetsp:Transcript_9455/g.26359  ORF Transcript_9455/g.26359 Transcript_9455/m.26359 type:complete len:263 (-) Transcript_9455:731-1519(-)